MVEDVETTVKVGSVVSKEVGNVCPQTVQLGVEVVAEVVDVGVLRDGEK